MDVIYNYFFQFYQKILKDDEPHLLTILALSACEGFFINIIIEILLINYYCIETNSFIWMGIIVLLNFLNYLYFYKSGKAKIIVKNKPMFFSNNNISILLTILFFVVLSSSIFWGPMLTKYLLETHCR